MEIWYNQLVTQYPEGRRMNITVIDGHGGLLGAQLIKEILPFINVPNVEYLI